MTTNTPIQSGNSIVDSFEVFQGASERTPESTTEIEVVDPTAVDLAKAGFTFELLPNETAQAITDARQHSLDDHPFAPLAEGLGAPLKVPQPIASEQHPGQSYVTYSAPRAPEEQSAVVNAGINYLKDLGQRIADGPIGNMFRRLDDLLSKFEDKDTVELRKIHPLLGSGLGPAMTDADIPGNQIK
jgi:hypothetical protein